MKTIAIHNYYQNRGGEDQLFEDEVQLLESKGHQVHRYTLHSNSIKDRNLIRVAADTIWNGRTYRELQNLIREHQPDVIHSVNTFPLFSPSVFHAARKSNVPFVATIQNYRFFCAQSMCFRNGQACEACLGKIPWRAVVHRCYKNSLAGSAIVASMQLLHQQLQSWQKYVDVICVASEFSKSKLLSAGFEASQLMLKPNFAPFDPGMQNGSKNYAVFVGRLSDEKGLSTIVEAWHELGRSGIDIPLKIVGNGPDAQRVEELVETNPNVQWLGYISNKEVYQAVGDAACLIFPSAGYESLPKTLIESMAVGTPVIGSKIGSIPEVVRENETGYLFDAGDASSLSRCVQKLFANPSDFGRLRNNCRKLFDTKFTAEVNYQQLISIYLEAIRRRQSNQLSESVQTIESSSLKGSTS